MNDDQGRVLRALTEWIRREPERWAPPDAEPMSDERMDELVRRVAQGRGATAGPRWRRRRVVGGIAIAVAVSGGVAAAAILAGQPDRPHDGALCRAEARIDASAIVLDAGAEPIDGCRELWSAGRFEEFGVGDREPPLTACIGSGGVIEVFPGERSVCDVLGLSTADQELSPESERIVELQDRVTAEINAATCQPVEAAAGRAESILESVGLSAWTVVVAPDAQGGTCGKVAVDASNHQLVVNNFQQGE